MPWPLSWPTEPHLHMFTVKLPIPSTHYLPHQDTSSPAGTRKDSNTGNTGAAEKTTPSDDTKLGEWKQNVYKQWALPFSRTLECLTIYNCVQLGGSISSEHFGVPRRNKGWIYYHALLVSVRGAFRKQTPGYYSIAFFWCDCSVLFTRMS